MGVVYRARNRLMGRDEVLKVVNRSVLEQPGALDRFIREIQSAARLQHQNVVTAYTALQLGDLLAFAMEFVPGQDLAKVVRNAPNPLPVQNACYYVQQAAAGLQHAHEKGMVHRDIKPSNLILTRDGKKHTVKILDFGLAKVGSEAGVEAGLTGDGRMLGTPDYMAPEQARDAARADIRADIYSLGTTLHFLLAGRPPFTAGSLFALLEHHQRTDPERLDDLRPDVPAGLADVVARMMAKDPAARYQTPAEVWSALVPFVKAGAVPRAAAPAARGTAETVLPGPTPPAPVESPVAPARTGPDPWADLAEDSPPPAAEAPAPATPRRLDPARKSPEREPAAGRPGWLWPAVAGGAVVVVLLAAWAGGAFKVKTKDGTIVVENLPPDAEVEVDGETVTVTRSGETVTVSAVREGPHKLKVVQRGKEVWASDVTVKVGADPVRLRFVPKAVAKAPPVSPKDPAGGKDNPDARTKDKDGPPPAGDPRPVPRMARVVRPLHWKREGDDLVLNRDFRPVGPKFVGYNMSRVVFGDPTWGDLNFEFSAMKFGGADGAKDGNFAAIFGAADAMTYNQYSAGKEWQNAHSHTLLAVTDGEAYRPWDKNGGRFQPDRDRWYHVRVETRGKSVTCYIDGKQTIAHTADYAFTGCVGLSSTHGMTGVRFRDIKVTDVNGKVLWEGPPDFPK